MTQIIFEHPLNEKMRTLLRIEFLLSLIYANKRCTSVNSLSFFHALSELLDITERNNIRSELIKDIDSHRKKINRTIEVNQTSVDQEIETLEILKACATKLVNDQRMGSPLKSDRFISAVRQRLSIPGGCCSFDLPVLHGWLSQPCESRNLQVDEWLTHLTLLNETLSICMQLTRKLGQFMRYQCHGHYMQSAQGDINLIRIGIDQSYNMYPQVSGHMSRYSIRFIKLGVYDNAKVGPVDFDLSCC